MEEGFRTGSDPDRFHAHRRRSGGQSTVGCKAPVRFRRHRRSAGYAGCCGHAGGWNPAPTLAKLALPAVRLMLAVIGSFLLAEFTSESVVRYFVNLDDLSEAHRAIATFVPSLTAAAGTAALLRMKPRHTAALALVGWCLMTPNSSLAATAKPKLLTYTNKAYGVSFQYPSDWTLTEGDQVKLSWGYLGPVRDSLPHL